MKPCLFCGCTHVETDIDPLESFVVMCLRCGATGPEMPTAAEAEAKWNERAEMHRQHDGDAVVYVSMDSGGCMSDIVERLRQWAEVNRNYNGEPLTDLHVAEIKGQVAFLSADAADEIERLRERVADYDELYRITVENCGAPDEKHCSCVPALRAEVEALRAENGMLDPENTRMRNLLTDMRADPSLSHWHERIDDAWSAIPLKEKAMTDIVERLRQRAEVNRNYNGEPLTDLHVAEIKGQVAFLLSDAGDEIERLRAEVEAKQAEIDRLMLEYEPESMTAEQVAEWGRNQVAVSLTKEQQ